MMRSLWIAKTGMQAQQTQLDNISHNLANVATNGYKRSHAVFEDLIYQAHLQAGGQRGLLGAVGNLQQTSNNLDLAIKGDGFFQIQLPDGTNAYTRDGSFQLNANGQMVTSNGYTLLPGITIPTNAQSLTIGADGTVSVTLPGQAATQTIGQIQLANFVNPAGLDPKGQNLFAETAASGTPNTGAPNANGLGALQQGFVETSNVNVVEELVQMIQTQRAYELNSKAVQTSDQMLQKLSQI